MQLFFHKETSQNPIKLSPEESRHLVKVLRKNEGEHIHLTDGKGELFTCKISKLDPKKTELEVLEREKTPEDSYHIHLAIAPTKNAERMEWMLEKITEIGFHELTFLKTFHSERSFLKKERLEKKLIASCKQSLKTFLPVIHSTHRLEDLLEESKFDGYQKFIAYVDEDHQNHLYDLAQEKKNYLILIGPEGDFSPQEIQKAMDNGFEACSLGKSRLRTETAGLVAVHTLNLKNSH
ncbi:16S rRNA (uracil(1498)-N(3))-methyltransferase [Echinicola jeungdonensis]|uniref:Ribosomal RNA small subunit methyltransferase E n=1 Tax=Echinicola jeungdonensis TaxID=709343 RepID=A0ABV5J5J2_9BACT|nr:16S rRNA (uracil(1498)-N(3))-methyltransferase [Echinicola jeungdonensis]MDN3670609.1 16S rRNA (uracil(1498)-N(3))-methyltransferase [Echinicola jeungdonensis]